MRAARAVHRTATLWIHLVLVGLTLSILRFFQLVVLTFYRWFPFPSLLDWAFLHSRNLRNLFTYKLRGWRDHESSEPIHVDPRLGMTAPQMARHEGYTVEEHSTTTKDGFILGLHRIPRGHPSSGEAAQRGPRPAVLIVHGLMQNSEVWLTNGREGSLALILADAGFDVWLGNNRANKYSSKHLRLKDEDDEYWDFSLDDMARFDVPAMVDAVLRRTRQHRLSYIGFSQGTAQAFAAFSSNPDIAAKISHFAALSPAVTVRGLSRSLVSSLISANADFLYALFGRHAMLGSAYAWQRIMSPALHVRTIDLCLRYLFDWDTSELHEDEKMNMYAHIFSLSSVKCVVHWFQIIRSGRFAMFADRDQSRYHVPPAYDVTTIPIPVSLFIGGKDTTIDGERLVRLLGARNASATSQAPSMSPEHPGPASTALVASHGAGAGGGIVEDALDLSLAPAGSDVPLFVHREPTYEHLDFMWAHSCRERAFPALVEQLRQYAEYDDTESVVSSLYGSTLSMPLPPELQMALLAQRAQAEPHRTAGAAAHHGLEAGTARRHTVVTSRGTVGPSSASASASASVSTSAGAWHSALLDSSGVNGAAAAAATPGGPGGPGGSRSGSELPLDDAGAGAGAPSDGGVDGAAGGDIGIVGAGALAQALAPADEAGEMPAPVLLPGFTTAQDRTTPDRLSGGRSPSVASGDSITLRQAGAVAAMVSRAGSPPRHPRAPTAAHKTEDVDGDAGSRARPVRTSSASFMVADSSDGLPVPVSTSHAHAASLSKVGRRTSRRRARAGERTTLPS